MNTHRLNGASEREWTEWVRTGAKKPVPRARTIRLSGLAEERYEVVYDDIDTGQSLTFGYSDEPNGGSAMYYAKLLHFVQRPRVIDTEGGV